MGLGNAKRELANEFNGELPSGIRRAEPFCRGCLVLEGESYDGDKDLPDRVAKSGKFDDWQLVVLHDNVDYARSTDRFLWATWTRFNPATDIFAKDIVTKNNHIAYTSPIVIDARMKPWYPKEVEPREDIVRLVDTRWAEYFG